VRRSPFEDFDEDEKPTKAQEREFKRKTHIQAGHLFGLIGGLAHIEEWARCEQSRTLAEIKKEFGYEAATMISGCEQLFSEGMRLTYKTSNSDGDFVYGLTFRGRLLVEMMKSIWVVLEYEADERYKKERGLAKAKRTRREKASEK
jgi:hypothetical protein